MKLRISGQQEVPSFYGHGKLLITAEYFVLDGALALALPTKFGQTLRVKPLHAAEGILYWVALNNRGSAWLNLVFDTFDFSCLNTTQEEAQRLTKILLEARKLNPLFLTKLMDIAVETHLEFPNEWGLGSSSTLIHCIAKWAEVDAYELLKNTIGGSGYDVQCAAHETPILYQLKNDKSETLPVHWKPVFTDKIFFAYTGKKQLSSEGIKYYIEKLHDKTHLINELSHLTNLILKCEDFKMFEQLIEAHENIVGESLKMMRVKERLFADYWGSIKSLGAWGGDFVMLTNERTEIELKAYLKEKNISTVFNWKEIILD